MPAEQCVCLLARWEFGKVPIRSRKLEPHTYYQVTAMGINAMSRIGGLRLVSPTDHGTHHNTNNKPRGRDYPSVLGPRTPPV